MTEFPRDQSTCSEAEDLPDLIIRQLILLSGYAESEGFPVFEAKLADAAEALLEEVQKKSPTPRSLPAVSMRSGNNIVPFPARAQCSRNRLTTAVL